MANNTLQTITMYTKEAARILRNNLGFSASVNRQYDDKFGESGALIGSNLSLRLPNRYYVSNGANLVDQPMTNSNVTLQVTSQKHVALSMTSNEATLFNEKWVERDLMPAMSALATKIDLDGLATANIGVYNHVGTAGTTPIANATSNPFVDAGTKLTWFGTPNDNRKLVVNPTACGGLKTYLTNQLLGGPGDNNTIFQKNLVGRAYGFDVFEDQNVGSVTTTARANGTVAAANQTGSNLSITGAGANVTINAGDMFTIANVFAVNPENQITTGQLQTFTVTAAANLGANGNGTVTVVPAITAAAANVANGTVNAIPANGAALTWVTANTVTPLNLAFHRDAFVLGTADLAMPDTGVASRAVLDGISLRMWKASDISTDRHYVRIDVLYGWAVWRPEMACKILG